MSRIAGHDATAVHGRETLELTSGAPVLEQSQLADRRVCRQPMRVSHVAIEGEIAELRVAAAD